MIVYPYEKYGKRHRVTETRHGQSKLIIPHKARHNNEGEVVRSECGKPSTRHSSQSVEVRKLSVSQVKRSAATSTI